MHDEALDATDPQPSSQPKPIATRLESENGPCDRSASFCRSIPPTLHQMQECSWIGIQFLQGSPFNSRNNAGCQPARLTQLDYDHQRADLFKGNQRTAQVINLDHGAPPSAFAQRQRCQTFVAVPIVSARMSLAQQSVSIAGVVLLLFALGGGPVLSILHVTMPAFRVA